jgi:hypothetical protein
MIESSRSIGPVGQGAGLAVANLLAYAFEQSLARSPSREIAFNLSVPCQPITFSKPSREFPLLIFWETFDRLPYFG